MAKLSTYEKDNSISGEDLLAGSNFVSLNTYNTKNFKLADLVEFIEGQITISTQQATLKANGGLVVENINSTDQLAVNLSHTNITGQLANSDLVNSSITINGTAVSLGGSITIGEVTGVTAGTYLNGGGTEGTVTLNHDNTSRSDTTSNAAPAYGATFTVVDSVTTNATGHVTAANVKTVTIPASDNTTYDLDLTQNSSDVDLKLDASTGTDTTVKFKAGSNVTLTRGVVNNIEQVTIASQAFGTVHTVNSQAAMISATSTSGDIVIRTDVSKTFIHNGGSAGDETDFSELQFSGINSIDLTEGDGIGLSRTGVGALTNANNDLTITNNLATASERGGIQIGYTENGKNYPVELSSEKAYVNVPWVNTNQLTEWVLTDDDDDNTTINHGKHVKFVMATGALGTNTTGAGTDGDPYLVTLTSPNTTYTAGAGLDLNGTQFSHTDTSSQNSVNNSGRTYIQDITLDTYGHVTGLVSATETVVDTNQLTTWDLLDDDDDSFTISHDKHVKFTSGTGAYGTNITGAGTSSDPYVVAITSPNDTVPDTTYGISCVDGDNSDEEKIRLTDNSGTTDDVVLEAGTGLSIARSGDKITYTNTVTDTTNWNFKVDSGAAENISAGETVTFTGGTNVTLAQNGNTIDIAATNTNTTYDLSVPENTTNIRLAGSDGTNDAVTITGGTNVTVTRDNASQLTISSTNTTYTAGTGLSLSGTTFNANVDGTQTTAANTSTTTANRTYKVQVDDNDNLVVNVPWIDTTDPDTNNYVTGASVSGTTTKTLTLTRQGLSDLTAQWTDIDTNTQRTDEEIRDVAAAQWINGTNTTVVVDDNADTIKINATNTNDIDYINAASFNTSNGVLTLSGVGNAGASVDLDNRYLTSYTETSTLANVVSRGNTTNGTIEVTGTGSWLTVEGNTGGTNPPLNQGLAFGWNRSNGGNETEILFRSSSSGHNGSLRIVSFDGSTYRTLTKMYGNEAIEFTNANDITAEHQSTRYLRRSYDSSRYAQLESNSSGGALNLTHTSSTKVLLRSYDDCYFVNVGQVGFGTTSPTYPIHVTDQVSNTSIYASYDIVAYSDERVKEDIQVIPNALEKVSNIRGVTFKRKDADNENRMAGVIAQEIEKVLPEVVKEDKDGNKAVAYGNVVSLLIEAIKELSDKVKKLENGSTNK